MDFKIFFIFLVCSAEQSVGYETIPQQILENFEKFVNQSVEGALKNFQNSLNFIVVKSKQIRQEVAERVKTSMENVTTLVEESKGLGVGATNCIQSSQFGENLNKNLDKCLQTNVRKGKNFVTQAIRNVNKVFGILDEARKKLGKCQSVFDVQCFSSFLVDIGSKNAQVSLDVAKEIAEVSQFLATIPNKLAMCGRNVAVAAIDQARKISKCIEKIKVKHGKK